MKGLISVLGIAFLFVSQLTFAQSKSQDNNKPSKMDSILLLRDFSNTTYEQGSEQWKAQRFRSLQAQSSAIIINGHRYTDSVDYRLSQLSNDRIKNIKILNDSAVIASYFKEAGIKKVVIVETK